MQPMALRSVPSSAALLRATWFLAAASAVVAGCKTDYQQGKEDPAFGLPNALANQIQPGPSSDLGNGSGSSGATGDLLCVKNGGAPVDGGACAVSFKNDILGAFKTAGCDTSICHGGSNPPNQPKIAADDGPGTWTIFAGFKLSTGSMYIDPCSTDPTKSGIAANVDIKGDRTLGGTIMPSGTTTGLGADVLTKIGTWQKCAAPNN